MARRLAAEVQEEARRRAQGAEEADRRKLLEAEKAKVRRRMRAYTAQDSKEQEATYDRHKTQGTANAEQSLDSKALPMTPPKKACLDRSTSPTPPRARKARCLEAPASAQAPSPGVPVQPSRKRDMSELRKFDMRSRFKEGQKFLSPPVADALRGFYVSLLHENPSSKIAIKYIVEHGIAQEDQHEILLKKYLEMKEQEQQAKANFSGLKNRRHRK